MKIEDLRMSVQAWGFALGAATPQVAFGCDQTGRFACFKWIEYLESSIFNQQY